MLLFTDEMCAYTILLAILVGGNLNLHEEETTFKRASGVSQVLEACHKITVGVPGKCERERKKSPAAGIELNTCQSDFWSAFTSVAILSFLVSWCILNEVPCKIGKGRYYCIEF